MTCANDKINRLIDVRDALINELATLRARLPEDGWISADQARNLLDEIDRLRAENAKLRELLTKARRHVPWCTLLAEIDAALSPLAQ